MVYTFGERWMSMVDYRKLRFNNLNSPQFKHLFLLLYWPIYGIAFFFLERGWEREFFPVYCALDDRIPFLEIFVFPYLWWFVFLFFIHIYTLLVDIKAFKKLMCYIMLSYTISTLIFVFFPTMQELRPTEFVRDNFLVEFMKGFYEFDTNTNVLPSLHVVGSFAVLYGSWNSKGLNTPFIRIIMTVQTILISISTVFLKQHSIIDIIVGFVLSIALMPISDWVAKKFDKAKTCNSNEIQKEDINV